MANKFTVRPVILAAGKGKRIVQEALAAGLGDLPKVLYPLNNKPLIDYPLTMLDEVRAVSEKGWELLPTVLVVGHGQDLVREHVGDRAEYVDQQEMLGTGHAVRVCEEATVGADAVLVINGDMPAWHPETIIKLVDCYLENDKPAVVLGTVLFNDPHYSANFFAYGRIVRDQAGEIIKIVEQKDASEEEQAINECNPSLYCFKRDWLFNALDKVDNKNSQGEYYLTDVLEIASKDQQKITSVQAAEWKEALGVNTLEQLELATKLLST